MANFVYITLDTQAPSNPVISISGGAVFTTAQLVSLGVSVADTDKTGYQMLIWGDVDPAYNTSIKATEGASLWTAFSATPQIKLSAGDGLKTIYARVRDDVHNASSVASDSISLDLSLPTVTVTTPDVPKISKNAGKDVTSYTFSVNEDFTDYKIKLVSSTGSAENVGTQIGTAGGSLNVAGVAGNYKAGQVITATIKGADLETAGASSGIQSILKVFVKDVSGQWSV